MPSIGQVRSLAILSIIRVAQMMTTTCLMATCIPTLLWCWPGQGRFLAKVFHRAAGQAWCLTMWKEFVIYSGCRREPRLLITKDIVRSLTTTN